MTVAAAVLAIVGAGGRSAGRRLWMLICDLALERSHRKTMIAVLDHVVWMPGCAQVNRVRGSGDFWSVRTSSLVGSERLLGHGTGG